MDRLNKDLDGIQITDELHNNIGIGALHLNHDTFFGGTDMVIRTASEGNGTLLFINTDFTLEDENSRLSSEAGKAVYTSIRIINPSYQTGDLFFTYKTVGDFVEASDINETNSLISSHTMDTNNPHHVTASQIGLGNVENTAISTWPGSANLTTLGTITTGTWNAGNVIIDGNQVWHAGNLNPSDYLSLAGGTMTGAITLAGPPTADLQPATKKYVDDSILTGWINPGVTWSYETSTSLSMPGDYSSIYKLGLKLKLTQTTDKYFYVKSSYYSGGSNKTMVSIVNTTSYTLANALITNPAYSIVESPSGFPGKFAYSSTLTGFSDYTTIPCYYSIHQRTVIWEITGFIGSSNATTFTMTLPDVGITFNTDEIVVVTDQNTRTHGMVYTDGTSSTIATIYKDFHNAFASSGNKGISTCRLVYFV
ncbi:MAG TPA: hypothetical protein VHY08_20770 [Bacillota bacterium]|nr:hypothetical protein [Bacillota bacterium]